MRSAIIDIVGLDPLDKNATGLQAPLDRFVVLAGKQPSNTGTVWIRRFRDDQIVLSMRREEELSTIANCDMHLGIR